MNVKFAWARNKMLRLLLELVERLNGTEMKFFLFSAHSSSELNE